MSKETNSKKISKLTKVEAYDQNMNLQKVPRSETRFIKGAYYIIDKGCVLMSDGQWYRVNHPNIIFDEATGTFKFFQDTAARPYIKDFVDGKYVIAYSSKIPTNAADNIFDLYYGGNFGNTTGMNSVYIAKVIKPMFHDEQVQKMCDCYGRRIEIYVLPIASEAVEKSGAIKEPRNGFYVPALPKIVRRLFRKPTRNQGNIYTKALQYNVSTSEYYRKKAEAGYAANTLTPSKTLLEVAEHLQGRTFGVEIETVSGQIPEDTLAKLGFLPLRDGSLDGGIEYTSIPFSGAKGLAVMKKFYTEIQNLCRVNEMCSFHVHFGGFERSKLNALTLYKLCYRLQEEMFDMIPPYKKDYRYWTSKRQTKDHCQSLKSLNLNLDRIDTNKARMKVEFNKFFEFLTEGSKENQRFNWDNRHSPKEGANKWNLNSRYFWVNFLPYAFLPQETVEFRIFNSPMDFNTALNYLLISNAILSYVEDHGDIVRDNREKITLEDVISSAYPEAFANKILDFINDKRQQYHKDFIGDNIYAEIERSNAPYEIDNLSDAQLDKRIKLLQNLPPEVEPEREAPQRMRPQRFAVNMEAIRINAEEAFHRVERENAELREQQRVNQNQVNQDDFGIFDINDE